MPSEPFLPPGHHPRDQARPTKPPVDFHLERLRTYLSWNREHFASFKAYRESRPLDAENELGFLDDTIEKSYEHYLRLVELLEAGYLPSSPDS